MKVSDILSKKIIVAVRGANFEQSKNILSALTDGGIEFIEFAFDQSGDYGAALKAIEYAASKGISVGSGTTLTQEQVNLAFNAGAKYIISPSMHLNVIKESKRLGLISIPGAFSPTEILEAHHAGADIVKLFPASTLGAGYIKAIRAPINHVPIMVMGGVDLGNMSEYFAAGAQAIGVGSNIVKKELITNGGWSEMARLAQSYVRALEAL